MLEGQDVYQLQTIRDVAVHMKNLQTSEQQKQMPEGLF